MTYFSFLAIYVVVPLVLLVSLALFDRRRGRRLPPQLSGLPPWVSIAFLVFLAVTYTTPWDNYLVATGVWYYDPARVSGLIIGWVPIEEYSFFVLQTLLVSFWYLFLAKRLTVPPATGGHGFRRISLALTGVAWLASVVMLALRWQPGTYLALETVWFLPPLMLQLAFGGHIIWHHRRLVAAALATATLYLSVTDALAIGVGVWTISPEASVGIYFGTLPLEELVFFALTSALIVCGTTLVLARASLDLLPSWLQRFLGASRKDAKPQRER